MSEEFRPVTRKKWMAKRNIQQRPRRISDRSYTLESIPVDVEKFKTRLEKACEHMETSDYFMQAMSTLDESLKALDIDLPQLTSLVCFGIGPFTRSFQAFHQLAFILCTQRRCGIKEAYYFDPVFQESEKEILSRFDCSVMTKNCEAKYEIETPTLFYMPHCPNCLTNNLLWCNWRPECLKNLVLINNSFESLCSNKPNRILQLDSGYLLEILQHVKEFPIEDDYEARNVFNDLSIHVFPVNSLPKSESDFWKQKPAPIYEEVEMISADEFAKLNIS